MLFTFEKLYYLGRINLYELQKERNAQRILLASAIQKVPPELQPKQIHKYPEDNFVEFERWFKETTTAQELSGKPRTYLPILWTGYWCNNGYGQKDKAKRVLQRFVDSLPRNKAYWSICQYDDGPMVDFKDLDIKIFGMSGGRIDYPIPLLCQPHKYEFPGIKKDIFCSFVGSDTHPIRRELVKEFEGKKDCYVTLKKLPMKEYCEILARSVFALSPRGYGFSSFRIAESLHYNCTPIYISDSFVLPYNMNDMVCIDCGCNISYSFSGLYSKLKALDNPYLHKQMQDIKNLFTYEGCKQKILENI
jgi:hypothetical protein